MSIAARNAAASDTQSVTTSGVRDRKHTEEYNACVRRTGIAWIEIITLCICSVNFMFPVDRTNGICTCIFPRNARCAFPTSGEEEQDKRTDVTRYHAGRSLAVFAPTRCAFPTSGKAQRLIARIVGEEHLIITKRPSTDGRCMR